MLGRGRRVYGAGFNDVLFHKLIKPIFYLNLIGQGTNLKDRYKHPVLFFNIYGKICGIIFLCWRLKYRLCMKFI